MLRTLDSRFLSPLNCHAFFFARDASLGRSLGDLAKTILRDRGQNCSHPKQYRIWMCHLGSQDPCSVQFPGIVGVTSFSGFVVPGKP